MSLGLFEARLVPFFPPSISMIHLKSGITDAIPTAVGLLQSLTFLAGVCHAYPSLSLIDYGDGKGGVTVQVDEAGQWDVQIAVETGCDVSLTSASLVEGTPFTTPLTSDNPFLPGSPVEGDSAGLWTDFDANQVWVSFRADGLVPGDYDLLSFDYEVPADHSCCGSPTIVEGYFFPTGEPNDLLLIASLPFFDCPEIWGDANNDGVVNGSDVLEVEVQFGNTGPADGLLLGDANDDGVVNGSDVLEVEVNFGASLGPIAAAVPEPAATSIFGLGAASPICWRRRPRAIK